jgi:hypothetical protein
MLSVLQLAAKMFSRAIRQQSRLIVPKSVAKYPRIAGVDFLFKHFIVLNKQPLG